MGKVTGAESKGPSWVSWWSMIWCLPLADMRYQAGLLSVRTPGKMWCSLSTCGNAPQPGTITTLTTAWCYLGTRCWCQCPGTGSPGTPCTTSCSTASRESALWGCREVGSKLRPGYLATWLLSPFHGQKTAQVSYGQRGTCRFFLCLNLWLCHCLSYMLGIQR